MYYSGVLVLTGVCCAIVVATLLALCGSGKDMVAGVILFVSTTTGILIMGLGSYLAIPWVMGQCLKLSRKLGLRGMEGTAGYLVDGPAAVFSLALLIGTFATVVFVLLRRFRFL